MAAKIEFHTEWAIPEKVEDREVGPDGSHGQLALTATMSGSATQVAEEKWLVMEA